jgi:hypothetical protein
VIEGRIGVVVWLGYALVGISSFWQVGVIDRPQMPACPGRTALGAATETSIKRPFAIKAERLKRMLRPGGFHGEFRPIAAGLAYFIHCCFHAWFLHFKETMFNRSPGDLSGRNPSDPLLAA